ncbi:MAG TPA: trypsin-like peptidase domain-containing protein, partial [Candidatus Sulfotelmatobacter sp.]|nr:trypsin-like peptidase domain-containing protein [Candidatus Sulfotelmatobacter sp.]
YNPWGTPPPPYRPPKTPWARSLLLAVAAACLFAVLGGGSFFAAWLNGLGASSSGVGVFPLQQGLPGGTGSGRLNVSPIASQVTPAVVDITSSFPEGTGAGTGMVISSNGEVLTNNHVVEGANAIVGQIAGAGALHRIRVIGTDPSSDVALVQLQGVSGLKTVSVGDSSTVSVGDPVVAIGNALGRQGPPAVAQGQVVALDRTVTASDETGLSAETLSGLIQVNAPIVPGDSGGPLVDSSGKVIGIDTAAAAPRFRFQPSSSMGFAIPINSAMAVASQLRSTRSGSANSQPGQRALLGVEIQDADQPGEGALVVGVQSGGPADSAGIRQGDNIISVDGKSIASASDLSAAIRRHHPGDRVQVVWVDTGGSEHTHTVALV